MRKLSEQQAICDAATPGPWNVLTIHDENGFCVSVKGGVEATMADLNLMDAARNDYPALIDWAKKARELLHDIGMDGDLSPMHGQVNLHRYRDRFQQLLEELQP